MGVVKIDSLQDDRLAQYRDLRNKSHYRTTGYFVAEGWRVVERLLRSGLTVDSILVSERRAELMVPKFADRADVLILPQKEAEELVGYNFHGGVLASALKPDNPSLSALLNGPPTAPVLCCPHLTGPDNLGSLTRLAAGFGAAGILLGEGSVDPYLRRCVRVSMGTIFQMPIRTAENVLAELQQLKTEHNSDLLAAEDSEQSRPLYELPAATPGKRRVLLLGNEADGLGQPFLKLVDAVYDIPMADGVDSLNIANAAGIFLYELTSERPRP